MAKTPEPHSPKPDRTGSSVTDNLAERIGRASKSRSAAKAAENFRQREMTGFGRAFRLASEFVAAIIVGTALGFAIDAALGTTPWAMIVLLLLGFAAGVLNVIRAAAQINAEAANQPVPASVPDDDDDD